MQVMHHKHMQHNGYSHSEKGVSMCCQPAPIHRLFAFKAAVSAACANPAALQHDSAPCVKDEFIQILDSKEPR